MKENITNNKDKTKFLLKVIFCFSLLLIIFLLSNTKVFAGEENEDKEFWYLSDIPYVSQSSWSIFMDKAGDGNPISVKIENAYYAFEKGIWAHAPSTIVYDLNEYSEYDYFTAYMGLNKTAASSSNGVKFYIYTSTDGENWDLRTDSEPTVVKAGSNAIFVKIDIKNARYLKLYADSNGSNGNDHSVYADAKLIKEGYDDGKATIPLEDYDEQIREYENKSLENEEYELLILQRQFIANVGEYALTKFVNESEENKETFYWLFNNLENLRLYVLGGTPEGGSYYNSLTQLSRLYNEYSSDFTNDELLNNKWYPNMTYGDLYKKMAMSLSLTHSQTVGLWMQSGAKENKSDALERYAIFKYLHKNGKLVATESLDITPWFEALQIEEMRFVMNNNIDDEEILWLNAYVQSKLDQYKTTNYLTPHPYIAYVWPNYGNDVYYNEENKEYFNDLFAVNNTGLFDLTYSIPGGKNIPTYEISVTRGTSDYKLYKVWMNFRNKFGTGAVCGGISKSGSNIRTTHGIPATVIGQPGHAALLYYTKDAEGKGYWNIDNDVSGWTLSEKGERMLLGWGNASYSAGYSVVYMVLAQEALNDYENLEKCEKLVMLANSYKDDLEKQEAIYRKALEIQPFNIDALYGLINVYNRSTSKTQQEYFELAEEVARNLKNFPLPMYHLTNLIKSKLTTMGEDQENVQYSYQFTLLQTRTLTEGTQEYNTDEEGNFEYHVYQPSITRTEANYLLGKVDKTIATFSFDGADAGKIVLSSRFDGNGIRWDYSLDGKQTWIEESFTAEEEEHKLQLTPEQISSITAENDIYVHIVGVNYDEENLYKIDITEQSSLANLYANDLENRVVGVNLNTEWRYTENDAWTSYSVASPDLTGDKTVQVRQGATGTSLASDLSDMYEFTQDNQPDTRKYIRVAHLSIEEYSTQSVDSKRPYYAPNAIDGNINTIWHTDFRYSVLQQEIKPFITIKLDEPRYISALEFIQKKYRSDDPDFIKNGIVYVSMDGEEWIEAGRIEDCPQDTELRDITFDESVYGQYVKLEMDTYNIFASLAMVNLFEDITKTENIKPTAGVYYSPEEPTNQYVIARLVNPSTEITITNNDGKDTYIFTENGEFTFEFVDANGNEGSAVAKVTWIDKDIPTSDVEYKLSNDKILSIVLDNISKDVYLLDKDNNKINYIEVENEGEKTKVKSIAYLDTSGNTYKVAEIDENGDITDIVYENTTGEVTSVEKYVTIIENGIVVREEYLDSEGNSVDITDESEKQVLRGLQQAISNPLESYLEPGADCEFRLLDKASNITYKSIKADYINNDTKILVSDITYDITRETNKNVTATINSYVIDDKGEKEIATIISDGGKTHTFEENGEFIFIYKDSLDEEGLEQIEHKAKVNWIDKIPPTAEIALTSKDITDKAVATLINESETIIITNNGTSREYTFTENGEFTFEFEDIAGNKGTVTAIVDWLEKDNSEEPEQPEQPEEPEQPEQPEQPEEIKSNKYKIEESYISRIMPGTTIEEFKSNIETEQEQILTDKDGNIIEENSTLLTGMILNVGNNKYTLVVIGDTDEDGKADLQDILQINKHRLGKAQLEGISLMAGDVNQDGIVDLQDILQINKYRLGKISDM